MVLSNHWHCILTDPRARLPDFMREVHRLVAKSANCFRGRWECLWSSERYGKVRLETPDDAMDKLIYVLANAVSAGLIPTAAAWPGLWSDPAQLLKGVLVAPRPDQYFDPNGKMPKKATLNLTRLPGFGHLTDAAYVALVQERLAQREEEVRTKMRRKGKKFLGLHRIKRQSLKSAPKTTTIKRKINPRIAAKDPAVRVAAIERRRLFAAKHNDAAPQFRQGHRRQIFPAGTYGYRIQFGVRCETWHPPPD